MKIFQGEVTQSGTYSELAKSGVDFADLLNEQEEEPATVVKRETSRPVSVVKSSHSFPTEHKSNTILNHVGSLMSVTSMDVDVEVSRRR